MRGPGDLPVLVLAGDLAAACQPGLTGSLADCGGGQWRPGERREPGSPGRYRWRTARSRVLNRGHARLRGDAGRDAAPVADALVQRLAVRIWIDGDCRTAPDGSSFAWQHWSHTFSTALASGTRRLGGPRSFSLAAEDYNHDLLTVPGAGPGRRSGRGSGPGRIAVGG